MISYYDSTNKNNPFSTSGNNFNKNLNSSVDNFNKFNNRSMIQNNNFNTEIDIEKSNTIFENGYNINFLKSNSDLSFINNKNKNFINLNKSSQIIADISYNKSYNFNSLMELEEKEREKIQNSENKNIFRDILDDEAYEKLDSSTKENLSFFNNFILNEIQRIDSIFNELSDDKIIYDNLKNALESKIYQERCTNPNLYEKSNGIENNRKDLKYYEIINEEKNKLRSKEKLIFNFKRLFDKIYELIQETFSFIKENSKNLENKKNALIQKLLNVKNQIIEYNKYFNFEKYQSKIMEIDNSNNTTDSYIRNKDRKTNSSNYEDFYRNHLNSKTNNGYISDICCL